MVPLSHKEGEKFKFKSVKKNIDIEKLKRGEYKLKDIVQQLIRKCIRAL